MHCKRCGKAIGTDRGICPFCGAMLSKDQMEIYKQDKKENMLKPEMLTEKFGEKPQFYEKRENNTNYLWIFVFLGLAIIMGLIILIFVWNRKNFPH